MVSRVAIFTGLNQNIQIETIDLPGLKAGEILVHNEYTTLCRSDLKAYTGERKVQTPTILGHETVGRIARFGPDSPLEDHRRRPVTVGDRITWSIYASDPRSRYASIGIPQKGENLFKYGHEYLSPEHTLHGGLAEFCILRPFTVIFKILTSIPLQVAALINGAAAAAAAAIRVAGEVRGKTVVVSGVGVQGLIACAMCKSLGARWVMAVDIDEDRLDLARNFRADSIAHSKRLEYLPSMSAQILLEFSGAPEAMESTLDLLDMGGTAVWAGATYPARNVKINAEKIVRRLINLHGLHYYRAEDLEKAVSFMEMHHEHYPFADLVERTFPLDAVNEAFACAVNSNAYRIGIRTGVK